MDVMNMPDPRRPIERIRRSQLREICLTRGITLPSALPPANVMIGLIEAEGGLQEVLSRPVQPVKAMSEDASGLDEKSRGLVRDALQAMPMPKLRKYCSERQVVWGPKDSKADLIGRILGCEDHD